MIKDFIITLIVAMIIFIVLACTTIEDTNASYEIREQRMEACQQAYDEYKEHVEEVYVHDQDIVKRCATYMTLVYAKESGYGKSRMCTQDFNCFGIKDVTYKGVLEGIEYEVAGGRFLKLESHRDGQLLFARLYMKWHLNKNVYTFVYQWSMTDRNTYVAFVHNNYWDVYNSLK